MEFAKKIVAESGLTKRTIMQNLRDAGYSVREIAAAFECSIPLVYHLTTALPSVGKGKWAHEAMLKRKEYYIPIMLELRKQGYSIVEIANKTGFSRLTVYKYIGKNPDEIILARLRAGQAARRFRERAVRNQAERDAKEMRDAA